MSFHISLIALLHCPFGQSVAHGRELSGLAALVIVQFALETVLVAPATPEMLS